MFPDIPLPDRSTFDFILRGTLALADVEEAGIRVDVDYLERETKRLERIAGELEAKLRADDVWKLWQKRHGDKATLGSRPQLADVLFRGMDHPVTKKTQTGRPSADVEHLESVDLPFVRTYLNLGKIQKLTGTYLDGIRREVVDGYLHPMFSLATTVSYRSSSQLPNFQNMPIRDPKMGKSIRRAFIPRPGRVLVEVDYSQIESKVAACYHQDPTMLQYIIDDYDIHRDMAAEIFMIQPEEVTKQARQVGKNGFVFPEYYGSYWAQVAPAMWRAMERDNLTANGKTVREHLASRGVDRLGDLSGEEPGAGTFAAHVKRVERRFWGERFPVYDQWRKDWWEEYKRRGWFKSLTGFLYQGVLKRTEAINLPVQGAAFQCLLWSLIRLIERLKEKRLRTLVVGQIHDSMLLDVPEDELDDVLPLARTVMVDELREAWPWIVTPLAVEAEASGTNWWEKEKVQI